ncbi:MAG: hypothetical protein V2I97_16775, partial [Desulfococcaceae bacterium]|nr:hypothetical protein [Desulfococcaceae bacterium]
MKKLFVFALVIAVCMGNVGGVLAGDWVPNGADMYYTGGNIGIGITIPAYPLHINGTAYIQSNNPALKIMDTSVPTVEWWMRNQGGMLRFQTNDTVAGDCIQIRRPEQKIIKLGFSEGDGTPTYTFTYDGNSNKLFLHDEYYNLDCMTFVQQTGNVGIGTAVPQSKLAVNGTITAKEVVVTTDGWADYVFDKDYKLMPLT